MSIKENINYIKEELGQEEKFLSNFLKAERYLTKNKKKLLIVAIIAIVVAIIYSSYSYIQTQNNYMANVAYNNLIKNGKNDNDINVLKNNNEKLYNIYLAQIMIKNKDFSKIDNINIKVLKEILKYNKLTLSNNVNKLKEYSIQEKSMFKEFAILNQALLLAQKNKVQKARDALKFIPRSSKLYDFVKLTKHYLITK